MAFFCCTPCITFFKAALLIAVAGSSQAKVAKLVGCFTNHIDIVWLNIHVNHVSGMHMLQSQTYLQHNEQVEPRNSNFVLGLTMPENEAGSQTNTYLIQQIID